MNSTLVERIADAVLYEGYILYPYRPSVKNYQRWTFGGLFPEAYQRSPGDSDRSSFQAECLVHGRLATRIEVRCRFLHLTARQVGTIDPPLADWSDGSQPESHPVDSLRVGDKQYQTWQEAEERDVRTGDLRIGQFASQPWEQSFEFLGGRKREPISNADGSIVAVLERTQYSVAGLIQISAAELKPGLYRVTLRVTCTSPLDEHANREEALLRTLISTHAILEVAEGEFVSLLDPPEDWREAANGCQNLGVWPVLVGEEGQKATILASPIILYDYPQIAPESQGDFFDGTEIDEILSLRIMTLTDDEKQAMIAVDERAGALLARTEAMDGDQLMSLHGTVRKVRSPMRGG